VTGAATGFHRLDERTIHEWGIWSLVSAEFEAPDGERFERHIVRSPGAVAVVPLLFDPEGNASIVLVDQYRPAFDRVIRELPAGMRDVEDEPPEATAQRELIEEVGYRARRLTFLLEYLPSTGMTDATMQLYLGTDLQPAARDLHGPEERQMTVVHLPFDEALRQVQDGRITNVGAVVGILLVAGRLGLGPG